MAQPQGTVGRYSDVTVEGSILEPNPITVEDDAELAGRITVPEGFEVAVIGRELGNIRILAVHGEHVYATRRAEGDLIRLDDANGDGSFEGFTIVAARPGLHGVTFHDDTAYIVTVKEVFTAPVNEDGSLGELTRIINDLPDGGQHANRTLAVGPDNMLYITAGSTCNECLETNVENATILRANLDGTGRTIFASGLRNTIGFGWEPTSGVLYGADHGIDWLGDDEQQEELNRIEQGNFYGWPFLYEDDVVNPHIDPPQGLDHDTIAERAEANLLSYTPHAAPMQMTFYTGDAFPAEYRGDAFVAMRGSWNRRPPSGYELTRVDFQDGEPADWTSFASGYLSEEGENGYGFLARLTGVTEDSDGSLLLGDDFNGILYRITYTGEASSDDTAQALPETAPNVVEPPEPSDIAFNLVDTDGTLDVSAGTFKAGAAIPVGHSADGHNASPPLQWSEGPDGTQSYAVIVDDPDAAQPKPFVHWVLFDVPADITQLREGVATEEVVPDPMNAKQGTNSRGSTGYYGPRPPLNDPAHHYHFQVFALDVAELDVDPSATREDVLAAMEGHVLAKGEVIGRYQRPAPETPEN